MLGLGNSMTSGVALEESDIIAGIDDLQLWLKKGVGLTLDSNNDGKLDHTTDLDDGYIEVDIDTILGNNPVKDPDIKEPTIKPGTKPRKPRWKEITRPGVDPRPKARIGRKKPSITRRGMYK